MRHRLDVYRRDDGNWGWRLHCVIGRVIAQDGGDGFADRVTAVMTARELLAGDLEVVVAEEPELQVLEFAAFNGNGHGADH